MKKRQSPKAKKPQLKLNKQTLKKLTVKSGIRAGCPDDCTCARRMQ